MPWMENDAMSERLKFVARHLEGERMTDLCKEFQISRKTGYKLVRRFEEEGAAAFGDKPRAPKNHPNKTTPSQERVVVDLRQTHPTWGARKIKAYLERRGKFAPAKSTIHAILRRNDLVLAKRRKARTGKATGTLLSRPQSPNDLWCADFKGQFKLGDKRYCYPLTVTDLMSRYLLLCEALEDVSESPCIQAFHDLFLERGLPVAIRTDNGVPFATQSYFGLSKLSVFWIRQGIQIERIVPGHPEENGSHERMHRTLKAEATKPPCSNILSQQEKFDAFREVFNVERPHEALEMKSPRDVYQKSLREYDPDPAPLAYNDHDKTVRVTKCGSIYIEGTTANFRAFIGVPFGGYRVGLRRVDDAVWQVDFMDHTLGFIDEDHKKIQIPINPFLRGRVPMG